MCRKFLIYIELHKNFRDISEREIHYRSLSHVAAQKSQQIGYCDVLTTTKSKLYFLLSSSRKLRVIDKNNFVVGDVNIKGKDYGVIGGRDFPYPL